MIAVVTLDRILANELKLLELAERCGVCVDFRNQLGRQPLLHLRRNACGRRVSGENVLEERLETRRFCGIFGIWSGNGCGSHKGDRGDDRYGCDKKSSAFHGTSS